ncbi:PIR Superfamily Protein [Plasmodium ovale wallikeri]|uniref:PIR Superfamily Protein n=1 Tax=Plasmodium ovale wallikeri TaxID=864142 RepID=A0A1A9AGW6_PLAOA|nr:PIR Superfamily Protein [Plasmodium ovale wallikeri]SBT57953.1 PIR Superfamily Protein [Plasmodium ovale wallikeri]
MNDSFFNGWQKKYPPFMNLPLRMIYHKFSLYYNHVTVGSSLCNNYIEDSHPERNIILPLCHKANSVLKRLKTLTARELDITKLCEYLSYFLYDKIKNSTSNSNVEEFYQILNQIKKSYDLNDDKCELKNYKMDMLVFKNKKNLYIYSDILNWIKKKSVFNTFYSSYYNNYLDECVKSYKEAANANNCKYFQHFKGELECFLNNFNDTKNFLKQKGITISEAAENIEKYTCPSEADSAFTPKVFTGSEDGTPVQDINGPPDVEVHSMSTPNNGKGITAGIASSMITGMSLIFFFLYKFTHIPSWLHHKIRRIKKESDLEGKSDEFILHTSENESMNLYKDEYNLNYNSSIYS